MKSLTVHLWLSLWINCCALCQESANIIFLIVNIIIMFSKSSDDDNQNHYNTNTSMTRTSLNMKTKWLFFFKFVYFERDSTWVERGQRDRGRERERIPSRLCTVSTKPDMGLKPMNCEIMTWAQLKSQMLNQLGEVTLTQSWGDPTWLFLIPLDWKYK